MPFTFFGCQIMTQKMTLMTNWLKFKCIFFMILIQIICTFKYLVYTYRQLNSICYLVGGLCFTCEINAQKPFKCDSNSIIRSSAMRNGRILFRKIVDFYSHQCASAYMMRDHVNYTWPSKMCDMKR